MNNAFASDPRRPAPHTLLNNPVDFLALGFGSGCAPVAPGTFGTLAAVPVYLLLCHLPAVTYAVATLAFFAAGVWFCGHAAERLGVPDHPAIVWDEVVGYLITMFAVPPEWVYLILGFGLFRFFDIVKPWPVRWLDRHVHGGLGIMLDDVAAALFALACVHIILYLLLSYS